VALVSITRLRPRAMGTFLPFVALSWRSIREAANTPGFVHGMAIAFDRGTVFWTMTLWQDAAAMHAFRQATDHRVAMQRVGELAGELATVSWSSPDDRPPDWPDAHARLLAEGRFSRLPHPTRAHLAHQIPAPWAWLATEIPFRVARQLEKRGA